MMAPDPDLFPKGLPAVEISERTASEGENKPRTIKDMVIGSWGKEEHHHILLVGEGGIGKTVAMLTLPEEDWIKQYRIPAIYIPLQKLDIYEGKLNDYIKDNYDNEIKGIYDLASNAWSDHPNLLLLLDGFNEIPIEFRRTAEKHIREWMRKPGIQIITTSRISNYLSAEFDEYNLQPLYYETIRKYLISVGMDIDELPCSTDKIWSIINIPLMLTLYIQIDRVKELSKDKIVYPFLDWKETDNAALIIWDYVQKEIYRCLKNIPENRYAVRSVMAILAIAPFVCYKMAEEQKFNIDDITFKNTIGEALVFWEKNQELLSTQISNIRRKYDPHKSISLFDQNIADEYIDILSGDLVLFQKKEDFNSQGEYQLEYSLCHQNFRDALAAFYISMCTNSICRSGNGRKLPEELLRHTDLYVKKYIAEFLSDKEMVKIWDYHRKADPDNGRMTWILMDIIGRQRDYDYRELDFSGLDLSRVSLFRLLSMRHDICPLSGESGFFAQTRISARSFKAEGHKMPVNKVSWSPDGRQLASSSALNKTILLCDMESGESQVLEGYIYHANETLWSPDGRQLAYGSSNNNILIWNTESGDIRVLEGHTDTINNISWSPDGRQLASVSLDDAIYLWDIKNGKSRELEGHTDTVESISWSPDGRQLTGVSSDGAIYLWDIKSGKRRELEGHTDTVRSISWSSDSRQLASGSLDNTIRIWDVESEKSQVLKGHTDSVLCVSWNPDGRQLASGSQDRTIRIWDMESGENQELEGHQQGVSTLSWHPDGRQLASGSYDRSVRIWDLENRESQVLEDNDSWIKSVSWNLDGQQLASGSDDRTIRIWDTNSGESYVLDGHSGRVESVSWNSDGRHLASGSEDGTVCIWDVESGTGKLLNGHKNGVNSVSWSPDDRRLASCSDDKTIRIWDMESGKSQILKGHIDSVQSVSWSPDGLKLASGSYDWTLRIWDINSGENQELEKESHIKSVSWSPDGRSIMGSTRGRTLYIWDIETGKHQELKFFRWLTTSISWSPNGRQFAVGTIYGDVFIYNTNNGISQLMRGHTGSVTSVSWSLDGRHLASGSEDRTLRIWNIESGREEKCFYAFPRLNLCGANFELAIIPEEDKWKFKGAGVKVK